MACTAAVETEIDHHYSEQPNALESKHGIPSLTRMTLRGSREEELREGNGNWLAGCVKTRPGYPRFLSAAIRWRR